MKGEEGPALMVTMEGEEDQALVVTMEEMELVDQTVVWAMEWEEVANQV